jgi:hypothetical protein
VDAGKVQICIIYLINFNFLHTAITVHDAFVM